MRYSDSWARLIRLNLTYKTVSLLMAAVAIFLVICVLKLSLRDPIVVERQLGTNQLKQVDAKPTQGEITEFLAKALPQRFDTDLEVLEGYVSPDEIRRKRREQKELASRKLAQKVLVTKISFKKGLVQATVIRLIFVKNIISPIPFKLNLTLETKTRNSQNPYGLILSNTKLIEPKKKGDQSDS